VSDTLEPFRLLNREYLFFLTIFAPYLNNFTKFTTPHFIYLYKLTLKSAGLFLGGWPG